MESRGLWVTDHDVTPYHRNAWEIKLFILFVGTRVTTEQRLLQSSEIYFMGRLFSSFYFLLLYTLEVIIYRLQYKRNKCIRMQYDFYIVI